ncbi:undecaprenyl-phosphate galactose phosphotransferase WbaP [Actinobacillus pleuropneumoniae]|uniref:Undecaprenyl-phosphate galactose phosphotransferase WbaP n=2 Tax=Actinobacillus pleuropneumoniae TaxID=715 RepID=A0ABM6X4U0_ACTPL|nr:undecaprenyl-phosphate galactose phosphotransferase WbaP [Actinobacillus pleuropneumoniae]ASU15252.1 UDP-glucose:undecaprenyl-phosphate glucose-1-phosphate transferase [Actinobacillus pleuropneumoniae]AWG95842.1 undecaprenyl-phosphate galactose phosphotransferase WbaP [Actinobacillus pleuropneumoniae serovar 1 str. 4074]AXA21912.1 undecaprenyl-phosphate galactose phosphotransferase WbaP [Actinobacillus pleuropneumoniae]EFM93666.1 Undecaprenyl-phosphate galactose phosphotransferase, WbaP [Act
MKRQILSKYTLAISDFISFSLSFILSLVLLNYSIERFDAYLPLDQVRERMIIHLSLGFIGVIWFWIRLRHYTYRKPFWFELKEVIRTLIILAIIELATIAFSKLYFSRYLWGLTWGVTFFFVPIVRILTKKILIDTGLYIKNTVIIGGGNNAIDAYKALTSESYLGLKVKYFIALNPSEKLKELSIPIINEERKGIWQLVTNKSDQFIIALEEDEIEERDKWLRFFSKNYYRSISVIPTLRGLPLYSTDMSFLFSYEMILLRVNNNLAKRSSRILKRIMDILGSLLLIILLLPLLILIYWLVRKDGGYAIYGHPRIGQNGKKFNCLKFRSMVVNADEVLEKLLESDPIAKVEWEKDFKLRNDPRITSIGKWLRRTSLDELPQLFNVLAGQMSLVGPRPIISDELEYYQEDVDYYLMAKPGMTGLWQVSGRNNVDYKTRVYFDAWYVKNWSLWNDIAILFKTINVLRSREGAY